MLCRGAVVETVDRTVVSAAAVVTVAGWVTVEPEVSEAATEGPAGGATDPAFERGAAVVGSIADEMLLDSSGVESAIGCVGIEPSSATCWLRALTAWYAMGPATTRAVKVESAKARPRREERNAGAVWFMRAGTLRSAPVV